MLIYIKPLSVFPELHSDKLFGAIFSTIVELYSEKIDDIINDFKNNNPPFIISSTFPSICVDSEKIRFFPKVIVNNSSNKTFDLNDYLKDFKKVEYYEEDIFFDIINGNLSENDILSNYNEYHRVNNLLMVKNRDINIKVKNTILPNNTVNRLSNETKIFYSEGLRYGENIEIFCFIEVYNQEYESIIKSVFKFLKDRGFGRDISIGKGQFDYSIEDININDLSKNYEVRDENRFITLSRFIPSENDLKFIKDHSDYEISSKRSKDKSGEIRKQVRFFKEGSTFKNYSKYYGCIVESGGIKPAIEYGFAFPLNYTLKGD